MRLKVFVVGFGATMALATPAGPALAAEQLWVSQSNVIGRPGTPTRVYYAYSLGEITACNENIYGKLATNARSTDSFTFSTTGEQRCTTAGASFVGHLSKVTVTLAGRVTDIFNPKLTVTVPSCVYTISTLGGQVPVPGSLEDFGVFGVAHVVAAHSSPSCAKTQSVSGPSQMFDFISPTEDPPWHVETISG